MLSRQWAGAPQTAKRGRADTTQQTQGAALGTPQGSPGNTGASGCHEMAGMRTKEGVGGRGGEGERGRDKGSQGKGQASGLTQNR